uniref:LAGLIDADG endonuclease n=1 Tax=Morchella brunnea TaxID=1174671 RepID=A0A8K1I7Y2_9PEZI|nr:LAGLIDADG endonuclease [Morchella brunnea]UBU98541.1 LAGLIDADG endonuclease [Morchella brunnea]
MPVSNVLPQDKNGLSKNEFDFTLFYDKYKTYLPENLLPSPSFLTWFIGFTEGEGSFIANNRGDLSFVVTQSTSDIRVLHFIKETLGFGKVISQSVKTSRYVTQSKREIEIIITLFNGNTVLPTRQKVLEKFIAGFNVWVSKGTIRLEPIKNSPNFILPRLDNYWLAGFTDGEGCFTYSITSRGYTFNYNIAAPSLKRGDAQKGKENLVIFETFCELFNGGKVSPHFVKNVYEYRISGIKACQNIFPYFDKYTLYSKKHLSYTLWKELHSALVRKDHLDPDKRLVMMEKARLINNSS